MSGPVFTPPPGFTPPPSFTPPPVSPSGFTPPPITPSPSAPPPITPPPVTPPPVTPPPVTPPPVTPPPIVPGTAAPVPAAPDNFVPTKIRFPKWLRVADVLLVIAVVGLGIVLHGKYTDQVEINKQQLAAERVAEARAKALHAQKAAEEAEANNPFEGKRVLLFRSSQNILMAAVVKAPENAVITWDKDSRSSGKRGITIDKKDGKCAQFSLNKDGTWKSLGDFDYLTQAAKEIIAGNTDVVDKNGKIVFAGNIGYQDHLYQLVDEPMTWSAAEAECEKNGGHLISITSEREQKLAKEIAGESICWTGGTRTGENQTEWYWAKTGEEFSFADWGSSEPAENAGNCLALFSGKWMPAEESSRICSAYLCEWDLDKLAAKIEEPNGSKKETAPAVTTKAVTTKKKK